MRVILACVLVVVLSAAYARGVGEDAFYKLGPDSLVQDGVPHGKFVGPTTLPSLAYPGTQHTMNVYVPAQYDPAVPTALLIFNDGQAMMNPKGDIRAQNVIDNLTWRREIPTMITVFINPGRTPEQPEPTPADWGDRTTNRAVEYNTPDDKYARVICDEVMPVITKQYNINPDPDMHAMAGASSGGIAAFAVLWERPQMFHKAIIIVGSFTNIKGEYVYPDRVAAADKKPLRVFFCDGVNDNRGQGRRGGAYDEKMDWHLKNVRLVDAMTKKGYDINYAWGIGLHGQKQGGMMLPEMMRWLWRDYPRDYDAKNMVERSFHGPATQPTKP